MTRLGWLPSGFEVNVHLVTSSVAATQNLVTAANKAGILISDTVLEPLASSEACLTQDERDRRQWQRRWCGAPLRRPKTINS